MEGNHYSGICGTLGCDIYSRHRLVFRDIQFLAVVLALFNKYSDEEIKATKSMLRQYNSI